MTIAQEINFGFSPSSSADFEDGLNPLAFDDDFGNDNGLEDDDDEGRFDHEGEQPSKPKRSNNRKGPGNADKRATHNAVERARRESLNGRFSVLAESLPTMKNIKRPSKAMIVNKALDFVYDAQLRERTLVQENNELRREVDQLRARLGMPPLPPPAPLPQSKPATQATLRKNKKAQALKASAATSSLKNVSESVSPTHAVSATASSPSIDGAYPSPSVSAYSSAGSVPAAPLYDSPNLASEFATSLFPPSALHDQPTTTSLDSAPSPTDTIASITSPALVHPFLPTFDQASSIVHSASAPSTTQAFASLYNPAMTQAHLAAAVQAGMLPPQAVFNPQTSYLNNPAILYAMQQQYLAQHQQHLQQQQQQQQQTSPASTSSPQSFGSFGQTDSTSLWAGTPPSWGPFSHHTPSAVDGLSF
ncbi:hypothetical protein JCM11491_004233 [Sporobolomyces phaffii]